MLNRPGVEIEILNNQLGGIATIPDGTSLLIIGIPNALAGVVYAGKAYSSLTEFEAGGFNATFDDTNNILFWEHVKDFYINAAQGTILHVLPVLDTATMTQVLTVGNANYTKINNYITSQQGAIKLVAIALNPTGAGAIALAGESADIATAIPLAQALATANVAENRNFAICLELRNFVATSGSATDLTALTKANRVCVMASRDQARVTALLTAVPLISKYAAVGFLLGLIAELPIQRSIGRIRNGDIGWTNASLSDGRLIADTANPPTSNPISKGELDTFHSKGYIFPYRYAGKAGFYFGIAMTCTDATDDFQRIENIRVIDKAAAITYAVLLEQVEDEEDVDLTTGRLPASFVRALENDIENAVTAQMNTADNKAISGVNATIDPTQNVKVTGLIVAQIQVVSRLTKSKLKGKVGFALSITN